MRQKRNILVTALCFMFAVVCLAGPAIASGNMSITGTVNDDHQVLTDDEQIYKVAPAGKGEEMANLVGKRVKVTGTVQEWQGAKIITVENYEVIEE